MTAQESSSKYQKLRAFVIGLNTTQWLLIFIAFLLIFDLGRQGGLNDRIIALADDVQSGNSSIERKIDSLSSDVDDVKSELDTVESEMPD